MQARKRKYSPFGKKVTKRLVDRDMTARELAEQIGTTPQYVNKILHGERSPGKYLEPICCILDITT